MAQVIIGLFAGTNGYDILIPVGCLVAYVLAVKFDETKWKKGLEL